MYKKQQNSSICGPTLFILKKTYVVLPVVCLQLAVPE
jgi:hypothetical protein